MVILLWSATVAVRRSMFAESGEDIREKVLKTVLPSKAYAKVSCRLVPHQNHEVISKLFVDYINSIAPEYVQVKVTPMHGGEGYVCPISLPAYQAAEKGFTKAFGQKNHWLYDAEEVFLLSAISNRFWESKLS